MRLATRGYTEFRNVAGERPGSASEDRAEQHTDAIDRSLAEMGRTPTLIAFVWLTFYIVIGFAAFLR